MAEQQSKLQSIRKVINFVTNKEINKLKQFGQLLHAHTRYLFIYFLLKLKIMLTNLEYLLMECCFMPVQVGSSS